MGYSAQPNTLASSLMVLHAVPLSLTVLRALAQHGKLVTSLTPRDHLPPPIEEVPKPHAISCSLMHLWPTWDHT